MFGHKRSKTIWLNEKQFRERTSKKEATGDECVWTEEKKQEYMVV